MKPANEEVNHLSDRTELSGIYFQATSVDEQLNKRLQRERRQQERLPRLGWLMLALRGGLLVVASLYFVQNVKEMLMSGNIGLIFLAFGIGLVLFGLFIAWFRYAHQVFTAFGRTTTPFWIGFVILAITMILVGRFWPLVSFASTAFAPTMGLGFAVVLGIYLLLVMRLLGMYARK